jgi:Poly(R)-hydroxyalkanoic acid synthase subunit (PHA_synth_III_E)
VAKTVKERAAELGMKAMGKLFEDPKRAEAIGRAIAGLQQAKQALDEVQEKALKAAGLPTRDDFKTAGKRISALKRRVKELTDDLEQIAEKDKK